MKTSTSERAILTIKTRLNRYFDFKNTANYLRILNDIAENYNHTYHRAIGMRPADVKNGNQEEVRLATYFRRIQNLNLTNSNLASMCASVI